MAVLKRYMLIYKVREGKLGISCTYFNNSSNAMSVLYEVSVHKDFWITWENALSFTVYPAVKPEIMERIIYSF